MTWHGLDRWGNVLCGADIGPASHFFEVVTCSYCKATNTYGAWAVLQAMFDRDSSHGPSAV